jgi:hypothetical protein
MAFCIIRRTFIAQNERRDGAHWGGQMKLLRQLTLACLSICGVSFLSTPKGRAENAPSEPLDAICKTAPMPAGSIAVGEMESPECKESPPGRNNAWLIDKVHDQIVSCALPDYTSGFPPTIAYMNCGRVHANACPPKVDGTPNAFLLCGNIM